MPYIIIKWIEKKDIPLPVIMLDSQNEVWEFEDDKAATEMAALLEANSHTNTKYQVKKI
jgi:hypothetical protein